MIPDKPQLPPINLGPKRERPAPPSRRVPIIAMSEDLKGRSSVTGVQPSEFGQTNVSPGASEATKSEITQSRVSRLKRSITEMAGGTDAARRKPQKRERSVEDRTPDSVIYPKLDRPVGTTPKAREGYRDAQIAKAKEMGVPRTRVNVLPPDVDDYPEETSGPIPSKTGTQEAGKRTTRHTPSKVSTDFNDTKSKLLATLQEARGKHKSENTPESEEAYKLAKKAYDSHARRGQRRAAI